jgi:hypothetical protein
VSGVYDVDCLPSSELQSRGSWWKWEMLQQGGLLQELQQGGAVRGALALDTKWRVENELIPQDST